MEPLDSRDISNNSAMEIVDTPFDPSASNENNNSAAEIELRCNSRARNYRTGDLPQFPDDGKILPNCDIMYVRRASSNSSHGYQFECKVEGSTSYCYTNLSSFSQSMRGLVVCYGCRSISMELLKDGSSLTSRTAISRTAFDRMHFVSDINDESIFPYISAHGQEPQHQTNL